MVLIVDHKIGVNKTTNEEFVMLVIQGDPVMVQSRETGKYYLTARNTSIPSTFTVETATSFIGTKIPGKIVKVPCEEYEYTIQETGEVIRLDYSWEYLPEEEAAVKELVNESMQQNGQLQPQF